MINIQEKIDFEKEYRNHVNLATYIMNNVNKIYSNPNIEKQIRLIMVKFGLNTSGNFLNKMLRHLEKRILYMENEFMIENKQ